MIAVYLALCVGVVVGWVLQKHYTGWQFRRRYGLTQKSRFYSRRPIRHQLYRGHRKARLPVVGSHRLSRLARLFDRLHDDELFSR